MALSIAVQKNCRAQCTVHVKDPLQSQRGQRITALVHTGHCGWGGWVLLLGLALRLSEVGRGVSPAVPRSHPG